MNPRQEKSFAARGAWRHAADLYAELSQVVRAPAADRGLFLSSCIVHGQTNPNAWTKTEVAGVTPQQAWREWYGGLPGGGAPSSTWVEECVGGLPCNANALSCAPYK